MLYKKIHRLFLREFRKGKTFVYSDDKSYNQCGTIISKPYLEVYKGRCFIIVRTEVKSIALIQSGHIRKGFHAI